MGLFCSESVSVPKPEPHFFNFLHKTDQTSPEKSRGFWGLRLPFFLSVGERAPFEELRMRDSI